MTSPLGPQPRPRSIQNEVRFSEPAYVPCSEEDQMNQHFADHETEGRG